MCDNGKGIKREDMDKLFKWFGKLKRTADLNSEGIGMGLMICQNLVKVNKGTISVHSDGPNKGSTFSFSMHMKLNEPQLENISLLNANKSVKHQENSKDSDMLIQDENQLGSKDSFCQFLSPRDAEFVTLQKEDICKD